MYLFNFCHRVCKFQITSEAYAHRPAALTAVLCAGGDLVAAFYLTIFFYTCQIPARDARPGTKSNSHTGSSMHLCTIGNKGIIRKKICDVPMYLCMCDISRSRGGLVACGGVVLSMAPQTEDVD